MVVHGGVLTLCSPLSPLFYYPTEHPLHLQLDVNNLGGCAMRTRTYAKALHYKELEFRTNPSSCVGELIEINKELEQPSAAIGVIGKNGEVSGEGIGRSIG